MKNRIFVFILFLLITSCNNTEIVKQNIVDVPNSGWNKNNRIMLEFKPEKKHNYNLSFLIRNNTEYPYSNIFLIAEIENTKEKIIDTLEYEMADAEGKWLGSGFSEIKESKLLYKKNYQFSDTLNYKISLQHAVRKTGNIKGDSILKGINTVGIIIEKSIEN